MYNEPARVYCFKPDGRIHLHTKGGNYWRITLDRYLHTKGDNYWRITLDRYLHTKGGNYWHITLDRYSLKTVWIQIKPNNIWWTKKQLKFLQKISSISPNDRWPTVGLVNMTVVLLRKELNYHQMTIFCLFDFLWKSKCQGCIEQEISVCSIYEQISPNVIKMSKFILHICQKPCSSISFISNNKFCC